MKTCTSASVGIAALLLQASLVLDVAVAIPGWSDEKTSPGKQSRVAYGEDAADPLLTHFVELVISGDFGDASCGGTLLAPGWVITAAHCMVEGDGQSARGLNLILHEDEGQFNLIQPTNYSVLFVNPEYDPVNQPFEEEYRGDIALLRVPDLINMKNVNYPVLPTSREQVNANPILVAGGVGLDETQDTADRLEFVTVSMMTPLGVTPDWSPFPIESDHFTTLDSRGQDQDTCEGDSGGGIFIPSKNWVAFANDPEIQANADELTSAEDVLVGITSYGSGDYKCGSNGTFGVYTDVLYWKEWIEATIQRQEELESKGDNILPTTA